MKILIKNIKSNDELENAISYLQGSFLWSKKKANKLKNCIIANNKYFGIYGYVMLNNKSNLIGAILFFYNEYLDYSNKQIKVLNISSWYVNQEARGIDSLLMIKRILKDFPEFLITNVSANDKAYQIFKALNFKDSEIFNKKYSILNFILSKRFLDNRNLKLFFNTNLQRICKIPFQTLHNKYSCRLFHFGKSELKILSCKTKIERNIGFLKIRIRGLRILWTSDPDIFSENFYRILLYYFVRNFVIFITTHCECFQKEIKPIGISNQIYFSSDDHENTNLAVWSELPFI